MFNSLFKSKYFNRYFRGDRAAILDSRIVKARSSTIEIVIRNRIGNCKTIVRIEAIAIRELVAASEAMVRLRSPRCKVLLVGYLIKIKVKMAEFVTGSKVAIMATFVDYFNQTVSPQTVTIEIYNATNTQQGVMSRSTVDGNIFTYEFDTTNKSGSYCYYIKSLNPQAATQGKFTITPKINP